MAERISESELVVMEALWRRAPLSATDVADKVARARDWSLPTVKTLLSRLVAKGAVTTIEDGRRFLYEPAIARDDHAAGETQRLVDRLYDGRVSPLVAQLAERESLSDDDIAELKAIIARIEA